MILTIIVIILAGIYMCSRRKHRPPNAGGCWPIIGHTFKIIKCDPAGLYKMMENYAMEGILREEPLTIPMPGDQVYITTDPADAYTVLNSCLEKDPLYNFFKPWTGEGLFSSNESTWRKHVKLLSPTFNQEVLNRYLPELNHQAKLLIQKLDSEVGKGKFYHCPHVEHATLETFCSTAMGTIMDQTDVDLREQFLTARSKFYDGFVLRGKKFWLHNELIYNWSSLKKTQDDLGRTLRGLTTSIIRKRKAELNQNDHNTKKRFKCFMEYLLDMEREGLFTEIEVQEEVDTFTAAGSETVAVTLTVALVILGSRPDVQEKVVQELKQVFHGDLRDAKKHDLSELKYLEAVVKETLRLYPTIPAIGRTLDKDLKIKDYTLSAGSRCYAVLWGVNRHRSWGSDSFQFRPERWLDSSSLPVHHAAFFGLGKRRCVGSVFALMVVKTMLAHILRHFVVWSDVTRPACQLKVVAHLVPDKYISLERRTNFTK